MNASFVRTVAAASVGATVLAAGTIASAQTVVMQPQQAPAPPASAPVVVAPAAQPAPASPVIVNGGGAVRDEPVHGGYTRPNRALLMTGLVLFGAPYIGSVSVAATSPHSGDGNLWIPAFGPWLDLAARGGCPSSGDCGGETGNKVLLVGDGILQSVGVLEIIGAFIFPETYGVATVAKSDSGATLSLTPAKVGAGYGLSAVGQF